LLIQELRSSILSLAVDTSLIASPLYCAIDIGQYMDSIQALCFAIQHTILALVLPILCKGQAALRPHRATLAFTRYCHCQYCVVYIAIMGCRWETLYCAILWAMTGWDGVPKQRVGAQRMVLIRAQKPKNKTIPCIGQVPPLKGRVTILRTRRAQP